MATAKRLAAALVLGGALATLAGCAALLPRGTSTTSGGWNSFEQARSAIEAIRPYRTRLEDLHAAGLDPFLNPAVSLMTYAEVAQRYGAVASALGVERIDPGIRDCLQAGAGCSAYVISQRSVARRRTGDFLLDALNFRRETDLDGWSFNALVLIVDGTAVHVVWGGQPLIRERDMQRNPLGPLQGLGETLVSGAAR